MLTRGAITFAHGCATGRYYVSVFDQISKTKLGPVVRADGASPPNESCRYDDGTPDDTGKPPRPGQRKR